MMIIKRHRQRIDWRKKDNGGDSGSTIRREIRFRQSPERVWRALTEGAQLAKWLLPVNGDGNIIPTPGHRFAFATPVGVPIRGEVVEATPGKRLTYSWQAAPDQPAPD